MTMTTRCVICEKRWGVWLSKRGWICTRCKQVVLSRSYLRDEQNEKILSALLINVPGGSPIDAEAQRLSDQEIAHEVGVTQAKVRNYRLSQGIIFPRGRPRGSRGSSLMTQIAQALAADTPPKKIAADLGCTHQHVYAVRARIKDSLKPQGEIKT